MPRARRASNVTRRTLAAADSAGMPYPCRLPRPTSLPEASSLADPHTSPAAAAHGGNLRTYHARRRDPIRSAARHVAGDIDSRLERDVTDEHVSPTTGTSLSSTRSITVASCDTGLKRMPPTRLRMRLSTHRCPSAGRDRASPKLRLASDHAPQPRRGATLSAQAARNSPRSAPAAPRRPPPRPPPPPA